MGVSETEPRGWPEFDYPGGSGAPPILLIVCPSPTPPPSHSVCTPCPLGFLLTALQKWMTQRDAMKIESARKVDTLDVQTENGVYRAIKFRL